MPYFLTFQVVGWADVFTRKPYRDLILENLTYCRNEKGLYLFGYVLMTNHLHLVVQQKDGKLSGWVRARLNDIVGQDFKKFTSKKLLKIILENPQESRKEWLKMIFAYHAKFNKRSGPDIGISFGHMKSSLTKSPHDCMIVFARFNLTFENQIINRLKPCH